MAAPVVGFWTDYVLNKCNDAWLRGTAFTPPATIYAGLSTAMARRVSPPVELALSGGYARVALSPTNFSISLVGASANMLDIVFPTPTADWKTIASIVLFDAATGGNALAIAGFTSVNPLYFTRLAGQTLTIPAGAFQIARA